MFFVCCQICVALNMFIYTTVVQQMWIIRADTFASKTRAVSSQTWPSGHVDVEV